MVWQGSAGDRRPYADQTPRVYECHWAHFEAEIHLSEWKSAMRGSVTDLRSRCATSARRAFYVKLTPNKPTSGWLVICPESETSQSRS